MADIGRWGVQDGLAMNYQSLSPYNYAMNNPIRYIDILGLGPGDRVAKARSLVELNGFINYQQQYEYRKGVDGGQMRTFNRTGLSMSDMKYMDCSELVSRVLATDGVTNGIRSMSTKELDGFFSNDEKYKGYFANGNNSWTKSNKPEEGDVFLWRYQKKNGKWAGHTGIVESYDEEAGTVTILHAKGTSDGLISETVELSSLTGHAGWKGFFRPDSETEDGKADPYQSDVERKWNNRPAANASLSEWEQFASEFTDLLDNK